MVFVDVDFLPALVDLEASMASKTLIYDAAGSNVVFDTTVLGLPENSPTDDYFADCEVIVTGRFVNQRVAPCPLEVRGAAATWVDGRVYQWLSTQHAQGAKASIVAANGVGRRRRADHHARRRRRVRRQDRHLRRGDSSSARSRSGSVDPFVWRETRSESMMALGHGRAQVQYVTIGGSRDGKVTHYQLHVIQDSGAFVDMGAILAPFMTRPMASGVYDIPNIEVRTTSVVTNTTPTVAYRGAGRPEATAAIERAMDIFAAEIGKDPVDVRRINLIPKFMDPYTTTIGQTYDVGDYETALDKALDAAGYAELRAEQARRRASGDDKQLGIGVSVYVEITGGVTPDGRDGEDRGARRRLRTVYTGTSPHGQGHDTAWSMITTEQTGIPMDRITLVWGDTDLVPEGGGTMGSRSLQHGGAAVNQAAIELVEKAQKLAASLLEADEADVVLDKDDGAFHVAGTPAVSKTWADLAVAANGQDDPLTIDTRSTAAAASFPFGAHVSVVEVDTGHRSGQAPAPGRLRRRRTGRQPDAARRPDPRRYRPGDRTGAARRGALRRRRQPGHLEPGGLRHDLGRRAAELRGGAHGDPDVPQPARRKGHRRVRHDRLDARGPVRGRRRGQPPRRPPHRHARHAPSGSGDAIQSAT